MERTVVADTAWQSYEQVAQYLLNQFASALGLDTVEGKQIVPGLQSGTEWEIDAKGIKEGSDGGFIIVECRRYTSTRQSQEKLAGLAYRIHDTGAAGGIIVSPLGLQEGAIKVAQASNIIDVRLDKDSTTTDYILQFLKRAFIGATDTLTVSDYAIVRILRTDESESSEA